MNGGDIAGIIMALFCGSGLLAVAVGASNWLTERARRGELPQDTQKRAIAILQERFARGEIDRDEYLERRGYIALEDAPL